jgi:hypothetical protein
MLITAAGDQSTLSPVWRALDVLGGSFVYWGVSPFEDWVGKRRKVRVVLAILFLILSSCLSLPALNLHTLVIIINERILSFVAMGRQSQLV